MAQHRHQIGPEEVRSIRQVAELKFAEDLAPDAFEGYLGNGEPDRESGSFLQFRKPRKNEGIKIVRLPADDDPTLTRVRRINAREEAFIDTFDLQYEGLSQKIGDAYSQWRVARLNEMDAVRKLEKERNKEIGQAAMLGCLGIGLGAAVAAVGGSYGGPTYANYAGSVGGAVAGAAVGAAVQLAVQAGQRAKQDMEIHKAALEELGESHAADLEVTVVQVEGETVELKGSAEAKFQQWRELLKQIYEREIGTLPPTNPIN